MSKYFRDSKEVYPDGGGGYTSDPYYWRASCAKNYYVKQSIGSPPLRETALLQESEEQKRYNKSFKMGLTKWHTYDFGDWVSNLSKCFLLSNSHKFPLSFKVNDSGDIDINAGDYALLMRFPKNTVISFSKDIHEMSMHLCATGSYCHGSAITIPFGLKDGNKVIHQIEKKEKPVYIEETDLFEALNRAGIYDKKILNDLSIVLDDKWITEVYRNLSMHKSDCNEKEKDISILKFIKTNLWYKYMSIEELRNILKSAPDGFSLFNAFGKLNMSMTEDGKFISVDANVEDDSTFLAGKREEHTKSVKDIKKVNEKWSFLIPKDMKVVFTGYHLVVIYYNQPFIYLETNAHIQGKELKDALLF